MDTSKMSRYDWVVVVGALVFFLALFLPWYRLALPQDVLDALAKGASASGGSHHVVECGAEIDHAVRTLVGRL